LEIMDSQNSRRKIKLEQFLVLYKQKLSDYAIAKLLGVDPATVSYRRKWLRLPPHYLRKHKIDDSAFLDLYHKGLSDGKIGKILGIHQTTICAKRNRMNLPPHFMSSPKTGHNTAKEFYEKVSKKPRFSDEIKSDGLGLFRRLRTKGFPISTFSHGHPPRFRIFYIEGHEERAVKRIFFKFPELTEQKLIANHILRHFRRQ